MISFEIEYVRDIRNGKVLGRKSNPYRHKFIHMLNLQTLFEFCLPVIQDYGSLLKSNDFDLFKRAFHKLLLLFLLCRSKGSADYQRTMFVFALLLRYWEENRLPIAALMKENHTVFSEESGEIALSVLARGTPATSRADIQQVRHYWRMVKMNYDFHSEMNQHGLPRERKHRLVRKLLLF